MKRLDYLSRLSLAARWFMPHQPARELIEDYSGFFSELDSPEDAFRRFGNPVQLVKSQEDKKKIWRWHLVFGFLLFCLLFPMAVDTLEGMEIFYRPYLYLDVFFCGLVFFCGIYVILLGGYRKPLRMCLIGVLCLFTALLFNMEPYKYLTAAVDFIRMDVLRFSSSADMEYNMWDIYLIASGITLIYFGFGRKRKPVAMSGPLLGGLAALPVFMAGVWGVIYYFYQVNVYPLAEHLPLAVGLCVFGGITFILLAVLSLVLARMYDPRWRAVFIMSLMFIMVFGNFVFNWSYMSPWEENCEYLIGNFNQPEFFAGVEDYILPAYYGKTFFAYEYGDLFDHLIIGGVLAVLGLF